ncbi:hypothetical protein ACQ4PT_015795 [Festuca glaucescens]
MASLPVPNDLLAEIFLRLPTPADLLRASAACVSFRRVAAARSFVRRFRQLHAPPLLGFHDGNQTFYPAVPPHPSAPAARAAALVADFSFLPARARAWVVQDSRDGRILLDNAGTDEAVFTEVVVCDPLHWLYLLLPPIPHALASSVEDPLPVEPLQPHFWCETFLVPQAQGDNDEAEGTTFRVIWMAQCKTKLFTFVFSSSDGRWRDIPSPRWKDLFPRCPPSEVTLFGFRQYSYGCFYWRRGCYGETDMLVFDTRRMEFSVAENPPEAKYSFGEAIAMVEAGENRLGMFMFSAGALSYSIRQNDRGSLSRWKQEKETMSLGPGHFLIGSTGRYLLIYKFRSSLHASGFYALDVKTFQLEKMCDAMVLSNA